MFLEAFIFSGYGVMEQTDDWIGLSIWTGEFNSSAAA